MPTAVDHVEPYPCSLEELLGALTDTRYWTDRAALMAAGGGDVIRFSPPQDGEGSFTAVVRQRIDSRSIPRALTRFAPSTVTVRCTETWLPRTGPEAHGSFLSEAEGLPATVRAQVTLVPTGADRCEMVFTGTVESSLAVVGSMVEKLLVTETSAGFATEREFTLDWLTRVRRSPSAT
ncbi:DUF2505 domain-containing protein [Williamsia deligens]|uniref:DUF2505 domain-containing protein n=1 Tax=Williamsia deligens TaxID=321325 RepID=A0ABW3G8Q5_9NOCA|nr:DUF2505 domain-containing protein [Williamsia deligens]MCP2193967.1 Protein of unknown function (DUF2505) [Williamsia deligens]